MPPPGSNFPQPLPVIPLRFAQLILDHPVNKDARDLGVVGCGTERLGDTVGPNGAVNGLSVQVHQGLEIFIVISFGLRWICKPKIYI